MVSNKLSRARAASQDAMKMDMSPMIDMVFLLLIFFMIASRMITIKLDPKVLPPVADESVPGKKFKGRLIVNIYKDGEFYDQSTPPQKMSEEQITEEARKIYEKQQNDPANPAKLMIRADRLAPVLAIKKVTKAAAAGGLNTVIFSSYVTSKGDPKRKE